MGATAPIIWIRFQSQSDPNGHLLFSGKLSVTSWQFQKRSITLLWIFKNNWVTSLRIPKNLTNIIQHSKKSPARLPDFSKNIYQSYRIFQKLSGNVIGLF